MLTNVAHVKYNNAHFQARQNVKISLHIMVRVAHIPELQDISFGLLHQFVEVERVFELGILVKVLHNSFSIQEKSGMF